MLRIGFAGRSGAGKSALAWELRGNLISRGLHRTYVRSFAAPIKRMVGALISHIGLEGETYVSKDKDLSLPLLSGITPRRLLQTLGTEWGRHTVHRRFWLSVEMMALNADFPQGSPQPQVVIYDDVRFDDEARFIVETPGVVFTLEGPESRKKRRNTHLSEMGISPDIKQVRIAAKVKPLQEMADDLEAWLEIGGYLPPRMLDEWDQN